MDEVEGVGQLGVLPSLVLLGLEWKTNQDMSLLHIVNQIQESLQFVVVLKGKEGTRKREDVNLPILVPQAEQVYPMKVKIATYVTLIDLPFTQREEDLLQKKAEPVRTVQVVVHVGRENTPLEEEGPISDAILKVLLKDNKKFESYYSSFMKVRRVYYISDVPFATT